MAASVYDEAFANVNWLEIPVRDDNSTHVFHQYTLKTKGVNRDELREYLKENGVPAMVYYPIPVHKQKAYDYLDSKGIDFETTMRLSETVISLPMHTELEEEQLDFIIKTVKNFK